MKIYIIISFVFMSFLNAAGQTVVLYNNDFESPNVVPFANCGPDLDATDINILWTGTGTGTGSAGSFIMINTVETILINGPDSIYTDSAGTGGNYCLSMLSTAQDDKAALVFDSQGLPFANISFDLSAIDLVTCGGPFGLDTAKINIKVYDAPGGAFAITSPGVLLDEADLSGTAPGATDYTFNWAHLFTSLDISGSLDGNIAIVFDLLQSGYAAFDNIHIVSSISGVNGVQPSSMFLYPNPAGNAIRVDVDEISFHDVEGRLLLTPVIHNGIAFIDELPAGVYIVRGVKGVREYTGKLVRL